MICEIAIMQKPWTSSGNKNGKTGEGAGHALPWPIEMLSPRSLRPGPRNARTHSKKQIQQIADSMVRFGVVNPLVADENGRIVAGHARAEAARLLGLKLVPVIRVSHLSDTEIRAYMLADNKLAEKAGWDRETLAIELEELQIALPEIGLDLEITGFDPGEVDSIMFDFAEGRNNPMDQVPELDTERRVAQTGDLFILGNHRLLVGDARLGGSFTHLMLGELAEMAFLDPPYNVKIDGHVGGRGQTKHREFACASGEMTSEQFVRFLEETLGACARHTTDGGITYVCMDWRWAMTSAGFVSLGKSWVPKGPFGTPLLSGFDLPARFQRGFGPIKTVKSAPIFDGS